MTTKTPSLLHWLVNKRKRIQGEIIEIEKTVNDFFYKKTIHMEKLKNDLIAIDRTITLHEIPINPDKLTPARTYKKRHALKYGQLTRLIYEYLGKAGYDGSTTAQLAHYVIVNANLKPPTNEQYRHLRESIRYRLKNLLRDGWTSQHLQFSLNNFHFLLVISIYLQ